MLRMRMEVASARPKARYDGAFTQHGRSYLPTTFQDARLDISKWARTKIAEKSRHFERNNGLYNRILDIWESYTVGGGPVCQPDTSSEAFNVAATEYWAQFCKYPEVQTRLTFGQTISLGSRLWACDGEAHFILTSDRDVGPDGRTAVDYPRIQLIESAHRCFTPPEMAGLEGVSIIDGVDIDRRGRPISYRYCTKDALGAVTWERRKSSQVIPLFESSRAGQHRGLPICYPVIQDLHDLDDLQILEMRAARDAAELTRVVYTSSGELGADEILRNGMEQAGTGSTDDFYRESVGGRTAVMRNNERIEQFSSNRPSVATRDYWKYLTEKVCSGIGIPYVMVFPDSMQGTVYRGALDMAAAFFRERSSVVAEASRRIYEYVIGFGLRAGSLTGAPPDWYSVSIQPPRAPNVDVGYNAQAMLADLAAGATNWELIYGPAGRNAKRELRRKAEFVRYIKDLADEFDIAPNEIAEFTKASAIGVGAEQQKPADPQEDTSQDDESKTEDTNDPAS